MPPEALAALLGHVPAHAAARLLRSVSAESRDLVFGKLPHHRRSRLELQLRFPSESVGALMDSEVTAYPHHWTLGRLRAAIDERPRAGLPYAYVIDDHALLVGVVSLRNLDFPDRTPLGTLMRSPVESVYAYAPINSVGDHPGWRQHDCLPVTSAGGLLVGTLRHRDLRGSGSPGSAGAADLGEVLMTICQLWWTGMWNAVDGLAGTDGGPEGERAGADR
jgi:Mg/Co/Ni transporter MgtE